MHAEGVGLHIGGVALHFFTKRERAKNPKTYRAYSRGHHDEELHAIQSRHHTHTPFHKQN